MEQIGKYLLEAMLESEGFQAVQEGIDSALGYSDLDRAERVYDAAEYGGDGSTHGERIGDMREGAEQLYRWNRDLPNVLEAISVELDEIEEYHIENDSIDNEVG